MPESNLRMVVHLQWVLQEAGVDHLPLEVVVCCYRNVEMAADRERGVVRSMGEVLAEGAFGLSLVTGIARDGHP